MHPTCATATLTGGGAKRESRGRHCGLTSCGVRNRTDVSATSSTLPSNRWQVEGRVSGNNSPNFCKFKQISVRVVLHTQVVVLGDSCGSSGSGPLLGEVVAKFHYALVLFQHFSDLHLYGGTQLLSLQYAQKRQWLLLVSFSLTVVEKMKLKTKQKSCYCTWLSILTSVSVSLSRNASTKACTPAPVMKLDSKFKPLSVLFARSMSLNAWEEEEKAKT